MSHSCVISFHLSDVNMDPRSVVMSLGIPCSLKTFSVNSLPVINCPAVISVLHGIKWAIFVNQSITTHMASFPPDSGSCVMKSIVIDFHGLLGASSGLCNP